MFFYVEIEKLASSENSQLRETSNYALFEISEQTIKPQKEEVTASAPPASDPPPTYTQAVAEGAKGNKSGHVMISYQWDSQDRAIYIRDQLQEQGYNVWLDLDEMSKKP